MTFLDYIKILPVKFANFLQRNLRGVAFLITVCTPYLMWLLGQHVYSFRGEFRVGGEVLVPIVLGFFIYCIKSYANVVNKGEKVPKPKTRFTTRDMEFETVSVDETRVDELILYVADLEDWLEHRGITNVRK